MTTIINVDYAAKKVNSQKMLASQRVKILEAEENVLDVPQTSFETEEQCPLISEKYPLNI